MSFTKALFYPWIDIKDEAWLKNSVLYWDQIQTIVPESINQPYTTSTARILADEGVLSPLYIQSGMPEIEALTDEVMVHIGTESAAKEIFSPEANSNSILYLDKLPASLREVTDIHPIKFPFKIRDEILRSYESSGELVSVDSRFASFYMTLLATKLSETVGASLLTARETAELLAQDVKFGAMLGTLTTESRRPRWRREPLDAFGPNNLIPRRVAQGRLVNLAIENINVDPTTPVHEILKFRKAHSDELGRFRIAIGKATSGFEPEIPMEALRQSVSDIYHNEVLPSINDLKSALAGNRIRWFGNGLLRTSGLSLGAFAFAKLAAPQALLASASVSLITSIIFYNLDKKDILRRNPYTYLLKAEKALG